MTVEQARKFINSSAWAQAKAQVLAGGEFVPYPTNEVELWLKAIEELPTIQKTIAGSEVKALKVKYPGIYPEILKYAPYFEGKKKDKRKTLFKLKFPEAYELCYS